MRGFRTERDSMGAVFVPEQAYYGAQTQRAVENFRVSGQRLCKEMISALGLLKWAAAHANSQLDVFSAVKKPLTSAQVDALIHAAKEVAENRYDDQFVVDVYQTGSGTSSNMNANEVIANLAIELLGGDRFAPEKQIHPNDHVNAGQSTNDVFPSAIHVAAARALAEKLFPALRTCKKVLDEKAKAWSDVLKIGRTHLADATPITLGQEFSGFAHQIELSLGRSARAVSSLLELPIGGTAVGTGLNTHPEFAQMVCEILHKQTDLAFREAANHFEANAQRDAIVECHAELRTIAVSLFSIANAVRWLGSGPRAGFYEVIIPDLQPGSSIMPGKVNPVMSESLMQACATVLGNDQTIAFSGASGGNFQLNVMMPVMGEKLLESIRLLASALTSFTELCLRDLQANEARCEASVEQSLSLVTSLAPRIGYDRAAQLTKEAFASGKTIRELCREQKILPEAELEEILDPRRMLQSE